jgi:hypothetical protein
MLPAYSSPDVLAERILKAITMDNVGMNAEERRGENEDRPREDHSDGSASEMEEE